MTDNTEHGIAVIDSKEMEKLIYTVRGQKVMLDADLAVIYGYTTKAFNQQVKNNIDKFEADFRYQLTKEEAEEISRSKNLTLNMQTGRGHNIKYIPYAFTEEGIYMLMTILKGDLATAQSKALIRLFKGMKDYIVNNQVLVKTDDIMKLSMQGTENANDIVRIKEKMNMFVTKADLDVIIKKFSNPEPGKEVLILNGETVEAAIAYEQIYRTARKVIYIVDNYIGLKTLLPLKNISSGVTITVFSDNINQGLHKIQFADFAKEYPNVVINFTKTCGIYHDRYIILDYQEKNEKIYHCGASSKDAGNRITSITEVSDKSVYYPIISQLLKNPALALK